MITETNKHVTTMPRELRFRKKTAIASNDDILNFKGIKKLSFSDLVKQCTIKWGDLSKFQMNVAEANFWASYDEDAWVYMYQKVNGFFPRAYAVSGNRYKGEFINDFIQELKPPSSSIIMSNFYGENDLEIGKFVVLLEDDLFLYFGGTDLIFLLNPNKHLEAIESNIFYMLLRVIQKYKISTTEKNRINVVYKGDYGFDKMGFNVKMSNIDIDANYNDDFKDVSEFMVKSLNDKSKTGLYILSGEPGTGKTTWVRYLAGKIKRNIIFVSPDMVEYITDPSFIPFLMNNSDSVLIIEDAEPALQKRNGNSRTGAISNILNLTDGLLSDCLNISIVATFNTNTNNIDSALLRDGRLLKSYMFNKLEPAKATKLLKSIGHDVEAKTPMSLSEIYYYGEDNKTNMFKDNKVGFKH